MERIANHRRSLMGLMTLWIYLFHCIVTRFFIDVPTIGAIEKWVVNNGWGGVDVFLILSGYSMAFALKKHPVCTIAAYFRFEARRFYRIYSVLILYTVTRMFVDNWSIRYAVTEKLLWGSSIHESIYTYLWFCLAILIFYVIIPVYAYWFGKARHKELVTLGTVLLAVALTFFGQRWIRTDVYGIVMRIPDFFIGYHLGYLAVHADAKEQFLQHGRISLEMGLFICFALGLAATICREFHIIPEEGGPGLLYVFVWQRGFYMFCNGLLAIGIVGYYTRLAEGLSKRFGGIMIYKSLRAFLHFVGTISLEVYALSEWVLQKILPLRLNEVRTQAALACVIFLGAAGMHYISKSFDDWVRRELA